MHSRVDTFDLYTVRDVRRESVHREQNTFGVTPPPSHTLLIYIILGSTFNKSKSKALNLLEIYFY